MRINCLECIMYKCKSIPNKWYTLFYKIIELFGMNGFKIDDYNNIYPI